MATRVELSVGSTTGVPSLAEQIKRFKRRVLRSTENDARIFDRTAKENPAREPLTHKCIRVIVENFERLPAHDAMGGIERSGSDNVDGGIGGGEPSMVFGPPEVSTSSVDDGVGTATVTLAGDDRADATGPDAGGVVTAEDEAETEDVDEGEQQDEGVREGELRPRRESIRAIPAKFLRAISAGLKVDLDPKVGALYVFDENYWKRRCMQELGWQRCQIVEHGLTWKQLFFETYVSSHLEAFDARETTFDQLLDFLRSCQEYIFSVRVRQLLAHPDMQAVCAVLPNLALLDVTYGVISIGTDYERMLFGMKISDASCLAKAIQSTNTLASLVLQGNLIDDDLVRMLMTGLVKNSTITYLDVSHNKITNHGARLLSKLLGENSVIAVLNLADNQVHAEGGRYIGRALRTNSSLVNLNLRLNRLTDAGGRMLLEGIQGSSMLLEYLNLSANSIAHDSCSALSEVLKEPKTRLEILDLSCNELQDDDVKLLSLALEGNSSLTSLDLRMNDVSSDLVELETIEKTVHANEVRARER